MAKNYKLTWALYLFLNVLFMVIYFLLYDHLKYKKKTNHFNYNTHSPNHINYNFAAYRFMLFKRNFSYDCFFFLISLCYRIIFIKVVVFIIY